MVLKYVSGMGGSKVGVGRNLMMARLLCSWRMPAPIFLFKNGSGASTIYLGSIYPCVSRCWGGGQLPLLPYESVLAREYAYILYF